MTSNQWWRPIVYAAMFAIIGIAAIAYVTTFLQMQTGINKIDASTSESQELQRTNKSLLKAIKDCTEPDGTCFKESQARDAEQVGSIIAAGNARQICVDRRLPIDYTNDQLAHCVSRELDRSSP